MLRRILAVAAALCLAALPAAAQFYTQGNEPAGVRWQQIRTQDYKVIYPQGLDSLARVYATLLEQVKRPVGATAGYIPNQEYKKPLPVIIHPWTASANGMVAWTPRRMELLSTPDFKAPLSVPWEEHLVTHESRHVAQMQFANVKPYKPYGWFLGELFVGAASTIYCGSDFFEGDAVTAETELSASGRGRNSAFLEYYRAAFRDNDLRDYWKWRYGSIKDYAPDYYTVGYIKIAGMRSLYGAQDFTARYYERLFRNKKWSFPLFVWQKTVKEVSGKKFKDTFAEISDTLRVRWQRDEDARAPFMPWQQITTPARRFTEYTSECFLGDSLYAIRSGLTKTPELVRIEADGTEQVLSPFAYNTSALRASEPLNRLYWSEIRRHKRWELVSWSEIWYAGPDGKHRQLSKCTRWYNPAVSPEGKRLSVTEYPVEGGSSLLVIDARSGEVLYGFTAPAGLQIVESAWIGENLFATGIDADGSGIFDVTGGFRRVLHCGGVSLKDLFSQDGTLYFITDLGGVDELYCIRDGNAFRLSNSEQGGGSFRIHGDGLYYSALDSRGRHIRRSPLYSMVPREADFGKPHRFEFAPDLEAPEPIDRSVDVELSDPQPYNKLLHAFRLHSWAPIYVNYDAVSDLSFDSILSTAGLGATGFFQNDLGNLYGTVAYGAVYGSPNWTHVGEAKLTYGALWPKIEASVSVSSDPARLYFIRRRFSGFKPTQEISSDKVKGVPSVNASVLMYVPLNYSSGGWSRGFVPQVRVSFSNELFTHGRLVPMNRVSASLRGYVMRYVPTSCLYPKLGLGLEAGWAGRVGITEVITPNLYFYAYGYLPGLMETHGLRLSATLQAPAGDGIFAERYVSIMPRGMGGASEIASQMSVSPFQSRFTADYAFPFLPVDWSGLGPVAYVRNFECTLHSDATVFTGGHYGNAFLGSAGATVDVVLGNLLWIPFDTRIGVSFYRNFGTPTGYDPWYVGMDFSVDI